MVYGGYGQTRLNGTRVDQISLLKLMFTLDIRRLVAVSKPAFLVEYKQLRKQATQFIKSL